MISVHLARRLRGLGVGWTPANGDMFVVDAPEMDDQVFVLSDMVADLHSMPDGPVIGFNGTVEWALDSVDVDAALWLPHEHQLRALLGESFLGLTRGPLGWEVELRGHDPAGAATVPEAYALAVISLVSPR